MGILAGCAEKKPADTADSTAADAAYIAASEPAGAVGVGDARANVKDEEDVVLVGRIGGSQKPFVDGIAAFTIVDPKVPYCAPDEGCPTPWDYCCEQGEVKNNIAMIKIVDQDGNPVSKDAGPLLGVKELDMVVVQGKAKRDKEGNLSVLADQVFVKK
jgi:hypothetical protein